MQTTRTNTCFCIFVHKASVRSYHTPTLQLTSLAGDEGCDMQHRVTAQAWAGLQVGLRRFIFWSMHMASTGGIGACVLTHMNRNTLISYVCRSLVQLRTLHP